MTELAGPLGLRLDRGVRTLDLTRAVPEIICSLPDGTRAWVQAFVAGINHAVRHVRRLPPEFRVLGLARREWSVEDIISVGRLAAFDVTWMAWLGLLRNWSGEQLDAVWHRLVGAAASRIKDGRGSNSWAVAPRRSRSGAACIASDTHLPALLPNLWMIAGFRSPSYHVIGLMAPAIPAVLLGRNPWIAWGGTNLHATSSDLFDISHLPPGAIHARRDRLRMRFGFRCEIRLRDTEYGPIVSDLLPARGGRASALRWMGHTASDELSAMLAVNRARDWPDFRAAIERIAVPGQNMLYADAAGHIGKAIAVHLPMRPPDGYASLLLPASAAVAWDSTVRSSGLPDSFDPPDGFVASANNRPPPAKVLIGHLFSANHRINRLSHLLRQNERWDYASLAALQRDVHMPAALPVRDLLAAAAPRRLADLLAAWDGNYQTGSMGALAFELLLFHLGHALHGRRTMAGYAIAWNGREMLFRDLTALPQPVLAAKLRQAAGPALRGVRRYRTWGAMHRLQPRHPLASLPLIGRRYRVRSIPAEGGSDTVMKTAHAMTDRRHTAGLVSSARHISDLADLDDNWFVLLGGQDGWPGSTTATDQTELWLRGDYVRLPLRLETVRASFAFRTELSP